MTVSKKSMLLFCAVVAAVIVFFAASCISITADMRRGIEDAFEGAALTEPRLRELEDACSKNFAKMALASGGLAAAAALVYICFVNGILKQLKEFSRVLENMTANGDLTQRMKAGGGETGRAAEAFNAFMDGMTQAVAGAQNTSAEVARALSEAALNADASDNGAKEVSENIKNFSSNIAAQTRSVESFEEISAELLENYHGLSTRISEATDAVDKIADSKENAERNLSALARRSSGAAERDKNAVEEICGLNLQIAGAAQIAGEIKAAAEQSRRLTQSAWTEAASAGEHGRGFAAVFEAVNRLSWKTAGSASKIERLTASMNPISADRAAEALKASEGQNAYVEEIRGIFSGISSEIEAVNSAFGSVHKSLSDAASVSFKMRDGARVIQETGLENKRGAASVEEAMKTQANAIKNVKDLSCKADAAMKELKGILERFKTNAD